MFRSIQVLRGIAACGVVLLHAYPVSAASLTRLGGAGVDLFFVISGFIIATIATGKSPGQFFAARVWRIYPPWLIAVTPWLLMSPHPWQVWVASVTHWPVFRELTLPALEIGWTLSFEMLFYAAAAISLKYGARIPLAVFGISLAAGFATGWPIFDFIGNPIVLEFLMGVAIARLPRSEQVGLLLVGMGVLLLLLSPAGLYDGTRARTASASVVRVIFWGFPAALLVYGALALESRFRSVPTVIGDASYSIYLWHPLLFLAIPGVPPLLKVALAILLGIAMWRVLERPLLRLRESQRKDDRARSKRRSATVA